MRQYDKALEQLKNALELDTHFASAYVYLSFTYVAEERFEEAVQAIEAAKQSFGRNPLVLGILGFIYAYMGRTTETQRLLEELNVLKQKSYVPGTPFAMIYLSLGEIDKAFDWIEKAVEERHLNILSIFPLPVFDPLRSHPRYKALLRKMNLEP